MTGSRLRAVVSILVLLIVSLASSSPAVRIAAAETLSRMDWRGTTGIPALIAALKDHETKVKVAGNEG